MIQNNTIYGNTALYKGGGLNLSSATIRNCIFWANSAPMDLQLSASSIPSYSCIEDWLGGGTKNITSNPAFSHPPTLDFHLNAGSDCIDSGQLINFPPVSDDFEDDARPHNSSSDPTPRGDGSDYDIGADEATHQPDAPSPTITPTYTPDPDGPTDTFTPTEIPSRLPLPRHPTGPTPTYTNTETPSFRHGLSHRH